MAETDSSRSGVGVGDAWPALPLDGWRQTYATLHMWMQIVGKVRLALTPLVNHWWNVPLYVTGRGLSTSAMPCGGLNLEIVFDFVEHSLLVRRSDGQRRSLGLVSKSVADFYAELMTLLEGLGVTAKIWPKPVEISDPIPFAEDRQHAHYDPEPVGRLWRILVETDQVFQAFRGRFIGKCSPVHFFWGSFDLAVTRFSGRKAPARPEADAVTREAYSHECISHGFWPGGSWFGQEVAGPVYYAYAAPEPPGLREEPIRPPEAHFDTRLSEFILPYDTLRQSPAPRQKLMDFLQSTYEAGAKCAQWNRAELEHT